MVQVLVKARLLVHKQEEELTSWSIVKLATKYKNKALKVDINIPLKIEEKVDQQAMNKIIDEERDTLIQATIVKIMKSKKTAKHQEIEMEVLNLLSNKFIPRFSSIKVITNYLN